MFAHLICRSVLPAVVFALLANALAACGGSGGNPQGDPLPVPAPTPRFLADGLEGRVVNRLRPGAAGLVAATDNSAYRRAATGWIALGLAGHEVKDVAALAPAHLLASVRTPPTGMASLMESTDGGLTWRAVVHTFGGPGSPEPIHALYYDAPANRLIATGADALAVSRDQGRNWELLAGQWQGFATGRDALGVDPYSGDVWFGGQDAIEGFVLDRVRASGGRDGWRGLLPTPSVAKGVRFWMGEPGRVLVAGEGGIVQTRDNGGTWSTLLESPYRFHFDVVQDPHRPRRLVTAGWDKEFDQPQRLVVQVSEDEGATWRSIEHPDRTLYGGAWSMAAQVEQDRSVYYFGLYKGGVMRLELD
jgi:hypothetical protein